MNSKFIISAIIAFIGSLPSLAHAGPTLEEQLISTEITVENLGDGFYVFFGVGGNIVVSIGDQGVFIVDDQFPEMVPKYRALIRKLGGGKIDIAINTHWHYDHADGNKLLGPEGTWLISQSNSRQMMMTTNIINGVTQIREQPAYPDAALPVATFDQRMQFYFNGEQIDLLHFGPAHTAGDAAVVFRGHNAVHMGDIFNRRGYPFIDADNGGDLDGMIFFCEEVLTEIRKDTIVIPGHGPVGGYADLEEYVSMLKTIRERIGLLIGAGATLEEVIAANVTADWDDVNDNSELLVNRAFTSMSRNKPH